MRNGQLYVNDRKLECTEVDASESSDSGEKICEEVNDVARYRVIPNAPPDSEVDALRDFPRMTVPNGHCFVLGDNRNRSLDSRSFGPVRLADILGRVDRVWYPRWEKLSPREGDD